MDLSSFVERVFIAAKNNVDEGVAEAVGLAPAGPWVLFHLCHTITMAE